eukprot:SM000120S25698  [mRNA]  locus=s120:250407:252774:+ [translate_table: standard]
MGLFGHSGKDKAAQAPAQSQAQAQPQQSQQNPAGPYGSTAPVPGTASAAPTTGGGAYPQPYDQTQMHAGESQGIPADLHSAWGAPVMGSPAQPSAHPDNQYAAGAPHGQPPPNFQPATIGTQPQTMPAPSSYVQTQPSTTRNAMTGVHDQINRGISRASNIAGNVWEHMKMGQDVTGTTLGKLQSGAAMLNAGGSERQWRATFTPAANDVLLNYFACYLSTSTGPVAGNIFVSHKTISFISDRALAYHPEPGQAAYSYYKVVLPLERVRAVNQSVNQQQPREQYLQVDMQDDQDFWFMGLLNIDKTARVTQQALQAFRDPATTAYPPPAHGQSDPAAVQAAGSAAGPAGVTTGSHGTYVTPGATQAQPAYPAAPQAISNQGPNAVPYGAHNGMH